jgi:hypothetical protein
MQSNVDGDTVPLRRLREKLPNALDLVERSHPGFGAHVEYSELATFRRKSELLA